MGRQKRGDFLFFARKGSVFIDLLTVCYGNAIFIGMWSLKYNFFPKWDCIITFISCKDLIVSSLPLWYDF